MDNARLKQVESHFAFGKNWSSYSDLIGEEQIQEAEKGLLKLIPAERFAGASFMDIGSGSGLHALAASRLGASRILAVDIDPDSVATTRRVLGASKATADWDARQISVFDLEPAQLGTFDIVYSWGVLHHTGSMWEAVEHAAAMVAPDGLFALALYRSTRLDPLWKIEKRLYARAGAPVQKALRAAFVTAFRAGMVLSGKGSFREYVANYTSVRGMDYYHDVHDWLGGYPYEAALAPEVTTRFAALGFTPERIFARPLSLGLLGSGCDEYVYRRTCAAAAPTPDALR